MVEIHKVERKITLCLRSEKERALSFSELKGISKLFEKMIKIRKNDVYQSVYKLVPLAPILPFITATVERVFFCYESYKSRFVQLNIKSMVGQLNDPVYSEGYIQ